MSITKKTIYFSKYAEKKFDVLNKHKVYFTHELIEDAVKNSDQIGKLNNFKTFQRDGVKVIGKEELGVFVILTFYPVKV